MTDDQLLKDWEKGMSITKIAEKYGYTRLSSISERLNKLLGKERKDVVKLSESYKGTKIVAIPSRLIKQAGFDPKKEMYCRRKSVKNKIILELSYQRKL